MQGAVGAAMGAVMRQRVGQITYWAAPKQPEGAAAKW